MLVKYLSDSGYVELREANRISYKVLVKHLSSSDERLSFVLRLSFPERCACELYYENITEKEYDKIIADAFENGKVDLTSYGKPKWID